MDFYVYIHRRATDQRVFYVGKGKLYRCNDFKRRNQHWKRVAKKNGVQVEIIEKGLSEEEAFSLEKKLINEFGMENLCNQTTGGQGLSGLVFSEEHKRKIGIAHKGKKKSPESIKKRIASMTGRKLSKEHKEAIGRSHKGKKHSPDHIMKVAMGRIGKAHTKEGKQNIRKAKCKIVICLETNEEFFGTYHAVEWVKKFNEKASQAAIFRACAGLNKTAYGYHWRFK